MSLFGVVYESTCSWATVVSDYYDEYPVDTLAAKSSYSPPPASVSLPVPISVGTMTDTVGIPTCIVLVLGAVIGSALTDKPEWNGEYGASIGFLVQKTTNPFGLAKLILFLLVLSGIGGACIAMYSPGLSLQQTARRFSVVPRFLWTLPCFVTIVLSQSTGAREPHWLSAELRMLIGILHYVLLRQGFH